MPGAPATSDLRDALLEALEATRERTLALAAAISDADLERQIDPLMSPLVWDLAHIAAYEDLWLVHRHAGVPLLRADLAATYDAFETPRAVRGDIELLDAAGARDYLAAVRERALAATATHGVDPVHPRARAPARAAARRDDAADAHARAAGRLRPAVPRGAAAAPRARRAQRPGVRPRRRRRGRARRRRPAASPTTTSARATSSTVAPFRIARTPVTNATLARLRRGRRLRAPRVVERRGVGLEGAGGHHGPLALGAPARRVLVRAHGLRAARPRPRPPGVPRELVRGRRLRPRARRPAPDGGGMGDGGDLDPARATRGPARTRRTSARAPSRPRRSAPPRRPRPTAARST